MVSDLITIESLAIEAYATDQEIALWKTQVLSEERAKEQVLDVTKYIQHTNGGSQI